MVQLCVQVVAVIFGLIFLRLDYDQKGVMNINGAIFLLITNATFTNMFAVVNVSALYGAVEATEIWLGQHACLN